MEGVPEKAGAELIAACRAMAEAGLVTGTWGNASLRREDVMVITPSGMPYDQLQVPDLVAVELWGGGAIRGERRPSTELALHLEIYRQRPDIGAVMHTHSVYACAMAVARVELPPVLEEQVQLVGKKVPVAAYAPAGSEELARSAASALGDGKAVFLANHGLVGVGRDIGEALLACQVVEKACRVYVCSHIIAKPVILDEAEADALHKAFLTGYGQPAKTRGRRNKNG